MLACVGVSDGFWPAAAGAGEKAAWVLPGEVADRRSVRLDGFCGRARRAGNAVLGTCRDEVCVAFCRAHQQECGAGELVVGAGFTEVAGGGYCTHPNR